MDTQKRRINRCFSGLIVTMAVAAGSFAGMSAEIPFTGAGTAESPYLIQNKSDLISMSRLSAEGETFAGMHFKLTADINMQNDTTFKGINIGTNDKTKAFAGVFDGAGHTVDNISINNVVWVNEPTPTTPGKVSTSNIRKYVGFVGTLGIDGIIKNLTIGAGSKFEINDYGAGIVGYNYGTVENCVNMAEIMAYYGSYAGGIVGYAAYPSKIRNCLNAGNITSGNKHCGGVAGYNMGLISGCANTGSVTSKYIVDNVVETAIFPTGGITAYTNSTVENCINYGTVSGLRTVGGIVGQMAKSTSQDLMQPNDILNNINVGSVIHSTRTEIGAIAGICNVVCKMEGNVWDNQIITVEGAVSKNELTGLTGMATTSLTSGTPLEGFDASVWNFTAGEYPAPAALADLTAVKSARVAVVTLPENKNVWNMHGVSATLANATALSWKLSDNKFSINGNTVAGPSDNKMLIRDILIAEAPSFTKYIEVFSRQEMPLTGEGTETDPYIVSTTDDWRYLAHYIQDLENSLSGKYVSLTSGLDFWGEEFLSLASDRYTQFDGTFLGNNKLIEGIEIENATAFDGLFGSLGPNSVVKDLTVEGSVSVSGVAQLGAFAYESYGYLENCINKLAITSVPDNKSSGGKNVGGFIGKAYGNARFHKCSNKALIYADSNIGGFVGTADTYSKMIFSECSNEGKIVSNMAAASNSACVGGFVGFGYPATFIKCVNKNEIKTTKPNMVFALGGFIGKLFKAPTVDDKYEFHSCRNEGDITGSKMIGGLTGEVNSNINAGFAKIVVDSCVNTGNIISGTGSTSNANFSGLVAQTTPGTIITNSYNMGTINGNKGMYATGIAGNCQKAPTAAYPILIKNCHNSGKIITSGSYSAGIIGYMNSYTTIDSCYNTGDIESTSYIVGGIAATLSSASSEILNCWNTGNITGLNRLGGIVGTNAQKATVSDCWNGGNITSTATQAGISGNTDCYAIGGIGGNVASVVTRCFNVGTITGAGRTAGIIGTPVAKQTQLISCFNAGKIECKGDTCGNIIGVNLVDNGKMWTSANKIENCAYVTDFGNEALLPDTLSVGMSAKALCDLQLGEGVVKIAPYCYPVPATLAGYDATKLYSAAIVLNEVDSIYSKVTKDFFIGAPEGTVWTPSQSVLAISGNDAKFSDKYSGEIILTGKLGTYTRNITIVAEVVTTGIDTIENDIEGKAVWYDLRGIRVEKPENGIFIKVVNGKAVKTLLP